MYRKSILGAVLALALATPAAQAQQNSSQPGSGKLATEFSCTDHIAQLDDWMNTFPEPNGSSNWQRDGAIGIRNRADDACQAGNDRQAFLYIENARERLGMPRDTRAAVDVANAVATVRSEQAASVGPDKGAATPNAVPPE